MLASKSIAVGGDTMSIGTLAGSQPFPEANQRASIPPYRIETQEDYHWADQYFEIGDIKAVVAAYKNIPVYLQDELNHLVSETYRKKLITVPFLEASLLLLESGVISKFRSLRERLKQFRPSECIEFEQQKLIEFVTRRSQTDIVVMVLRSDRLISTMTLYPFERKEDIPSLSYLDVGSAIGNLPDVPALEVGRLAKTTCNGYHLEEPENRFIDMASMAAAFIVSDLYVSRNALLENPNSFICGDTHGTLIASMKRFFPLTVFDSRINPEMLRNGSPVRGMSIHFIQRQVLGSFESADELLAAIRAVADTDPDRARRIESLLDSGMERLGVSSVRQFDPKRFRVHFFHFPYNHPKTFAGLDRMAQMMSWLTGRSVQANSALN